MTLLFNLSTILGQIEVAVDREYGDAMILNHSHCVSVFPKQTEVWFGGDLLRHAEQGCQTK